MAALVSCCALLLVAVSCTASQWSKPIAVSDRRSSAAFEDWVPVASACPACPKEAKSKVVARQAEPLLQPPPAYQPSAQSAYIQQTLSTQQREIKNHFNTQGLLQPFIHGPDQFFNHQQYLSQTGSAGQQLVSPQRPPAILQLTSPQSSHQQTSASDQQVPQLNNPLQSSAHLIQQQTFAGQQLLSSQQSQQGQQIVSPQLTYQQISATQQLSAPQFNQKQEKVPQRTRRPPTSTSTSTVGPASQEEVQLLYVPVETLRQQQQAAALLRQHQLPQELLKSTPSTELPSTTLEPYQPPLSVYMGPREGHHVKISDVVKVLKGAKTIPVLDTVGPSSPQVFVGPSDLQTPDGYAKFELPYLSALESNRIERKVNKPPFFVAPLSFTPPPGYSKIPFPAPHVGSVVVSNVTENILHDKDNARKPYSLPPELPPINPELPSLVNSLQDHRNVLLVPQEQEVTKFIQAVKHVGLEASTERYTRNKQSRQQHQDTEATTISARSPNKQTRHRFQQPSTQYEQVAVTTAQPQYLQKTRTRQPPHPEFEEHSNQAHHSTIQAEVSTIQTQIAVRNPPRQPQYPEEALPEKEYTNPHKANPFSTQETPHRTVTTAYYNAEEESSTQQSQYVASEATFPEKQASYNAPPKEAQYPHLESVVITEPPTYTAPAEQAQYAIPDTYVQPKYATTREEIPPQRTRNLEPYSGIPKYTAAQDITPQRGRQHPVPESPARPSQYKKPLDSALGQTHYSQLEQSARRKPSQDYPVLEPTVPENTQYGIPQAESPQHEPQFTDLRAATPAKSTNYHTAQDAILLRPENGDEHIYKISHHRFQHPTPDTESQDKQSVGQEKVPTLQSHYQIDKATDTTKQPEYSKPQGSPPDILQSQYPVLESEATLTSTTAAVPVRETPTRGRSRGRYRPSSLSTTTASTRTRSPHSRGRRPVTRTTSEAPDVPASTSDQINTFESSRQPTERSQFETQRRDRTRTRSRGRSTTTTTTTTVLPQYSRNVHQGEFYTPPTTQHSRTDTVTESVPKFASEHQQVSTAGHVTHTQFPTEQMSFTQTSSGQIPQSQNGQILQNQFSSGQVLTTHLPSGSNSGGKFTYIHIPNRQISHNRIHNQQGAFGQLPNRNEAEQQIFIGQTAHAQGPTHEGDYSQLRSGQSSHSKIQSEAKDETQIHNTQIVQHISSGQVSHSQVPSENVRSNQHLRQELVYTQVPSLQPAIPKIPDGDDSQPVTSTVSKHLTSSPALSNKKAPQQYEFLLDELPVSTTQRQHSTLPHTKYRIREDSSVYQTTLPSPALDGRFTGQGDYQIVTLNRDVKGQDGDVTDKPSFVRIRGRVRGRPRIVPQAAEQIAMITTATPELQSTTVGKKQNNFLSRGSARKTQAPTTTPTPETTRQINDKVYTVRPSRRPQQPQTKLTTRGRIRRPTRPPVTTTSTVTTPSDHRLNEVPDVFTTEIIPTVHEVQISVQPQYDQVHQTQQKQQHYQSVEQHHEPVQHYQPHEQYQLHVQQRQPDQQYQAIQRHQEPIQTHQVEKYYQSAPQHQVPVQQYRPSEQYHQQYHSVERLRVEDQTSLPSDNQPQYGANDPERGEESQWSTRTLAHNSSNVIPNMFKYSNTQLEVAMEASVTTQGADNTTGTLVTTTEAVPLMLTVLPDVSTTTELSTPGHSRRRGNWIRVRVRPQKDIFETAESQNLATVAAANQIPGDSTFKHKAKNTGDQNILEKYSPTSPSIHGNSENHNAAKQMAESSGAIEVLEHQEVTLNFQNVPSFMNDNITVASEIKSLNNHTVTAADTEEPSLSLDIQGYEFSDGMRKHVNREDALGVTSTFTKEYSSDEETAQKSVTIQGDIDTADFTSERTISSWLAPPSGQDDPWNQEGSSELAEQIAGNQDENAERDQMYKHVNSSWPVHSGGPNNSLSQDSSRMVMKPISNQHYEGDDDNITTISPEEMDALWDEEQDSPLSSTEHYGESEQDSDRNLNWGGYEDWWAKTYANHRPYYTDEQLRLSQETKKQLPDSTSIWDMASFREYDDSNDSTDDVSRTTSTILPSKLTPITEHSTVVSSLDDYPSYQVWEALHKYHQSDKHSVKKANPQNLSNDRQTNFEDAEGVPGRSSIQDILTTSPEDTFRGVDTPTTENYVDIRQFSELNVLQSAQNITESTSNGTEASNSSASTVFSVPSLTKIISSTENIPDQNMVRTDKAPYSESRETAAHTEYSSESSVPLNSESNVKRTDTQSLMARILGTTTSTKISHETEICYRGRCIKTKTKDSDIDQFSTD